MHRDEIAEETRRLRDEYAKQFNYDLDLIFEDLREKQKRSERQYVSFSGRKDKEEKSEDVKKAA